MFKSLAVVPLFLAPGVASAQDADWTYRATLYGWLPAMSSSVETSFGTIEKEASGSDLISALDMAFMGSFSAQNGNWGLVGDVLYTDLSQSVATPLPLFGNATIGVQLTALSGYALYRVTDDNPVQLDLGFGFRNFEMAVETSLASGVLPGRSLTVEDNWTDPLIAARLMVPFNDRWFMMGFADFGGVSTSDQTWQVYAGLGYNFSETWSMQAGYRYMDIANTMDGRAVNIGLSGGVVGVTYTF